MMRQHIFEKRKRQTPKMTFVFVLSNGKSVAFFDRIETLLSHTFCYSATFSVDSGVVAVGFELESSCLSLDDSLFVSARAAFVLIS